jgi:hypothetical protein
MMKIAAGDPDVSPSHGPPVGKATEIVALARLRPRRFPENPR